MYLLRNVLAFVVFIFVLSACDRQPAQVTVPMDTAVVTPAANVNGEIVSAEQVEAIVSDRNLEDENERAAAKFKVVQELINQTLLAQKSKAIGLDQRKEVQLAIERAKSNVLAKAYLNSVLSRTPEVTEEEISEYYSTHPETFIQRKLFRFQEFIIGPEVDHAELQGQLEKTNTVEDLIRWLRGKKVKTQSRISTKPSESLTTELVAVLNNLRPGQYKSKHGKAGSMVIWLHGMQNLPPMTEEQAAPVIKKILTKHKRIEVARDEVKQLRLAARIELVKEYTPTGMSKDSVSELQEDLSGVLPEAVSSPSVGGVIESSDDSAEQATQIP